MKRSIICMLALQCSMTATKAQDVNPGRVTDSLRSMMLNLNPGDIGLTKARYPFPVFALVMETGYPEGSFTLSSVADGSTSLYFGTGGGIIGGGEHENVRKASEYLLSTAQRFYRKARKVTTFPKPGPGNVIFYFLTFDGVRSYTAMKEALGNGKNEFSELFMAAHRVITELRKLEIP